jgi:hypothetical protein
MGAPKTPGRQSFEKQLADLGPLPRFYTVLVQMKRPDFTAERIRRVRLKKAVDFEVLETLEEVSAEYSAVLSKSLVSAGIATA